MKTKNIIHILGNHFERIVLCGDTYDIHFYKYIFYVTKSVCFLSIFFCETKNNTSKCFNIFRKGKFNKQL